MKKFILSLVVCLFFITNVNAFDWQSQYLQQKARERTEYWSKRDYFFDSQYTKTWSLNQKVRNIKGAKNKKKLGYNQNIPESRTDPLMYYGRGDKIKLNTGERIIDMGAGGKMNPSTGEIIIDMGGDGKMNLGTGEYIIDISEGSKMNLGTK